MIDAAIAAAYAAIMLHQKDRFSVACFSAFCLAVIVTQPMEYDTFTGVTLSYAFYFAIYSTLSLYSLNKNHLPLAAWAAVIAFYDLIFAVDSFANYQDETLIWRHHETFVLILHVVLMCILSQKLNAILRSGWYNFCMLFNICKTCQPHTSSNRGESSKEVNQ